MTFLDMLRTAERQNGSMLCVGLDPEPTRFPGSLKGDASKIYDFCAAIVDATADLVIAFKPQIAYFAAHRAEDQLERLMAHMRRAAPQVPIILDAKRGDIGSTAEQYAKEAFERYGADAVTLSPFMGFDSVQPYLKYEGKGAFLLCRTSNPGGDDLQNQRLASVPGEPLLYEHIAALAQGPWNLNGQLGLVVGATYPAEIERVRAVAPVMPLLIPGVGAQGGDAIATVMAGWRGVAGQTTAPIIVNSSRANSLHSPCSIYFRPLKSSNLQLLHAIFESRREKFCFTKETRATAFMSLFRARSNSSSIRRAAPRKLLKY